MNTGRKEFEYNEVFYNSKKERYLTESQQENEASSTATSEDNPKILAFRIELEAIAQKHLGTVPKNNSTSTLLVNSGSELANTEGVVTDFNSLPTEIEEELLQFKLQRVWVLVDLPHEMKVTPGKRVLTMMGFLLPVAKMEAIRNSMDLQMYALTTNPTIHDSLVKQFWQTATAKTLDDGTLELQATIDTIVYTITEASIRSKLQLADASGITMLPNNEIFEGMGHMGNYHCLTSPSAAHEPMEHTFEQPSSAQQPPTPRQEATTSQLMARIDDLEKQLKETKQTFGKAILTLVERVKSLEVALKRKTKRLITPSKTVNALGEEQVEDISPTTLEAAVILTKVKKIKSVDKGKRYKRRKSSKEFAGTGLDFEEVKSAFEEVNTGGIKVSSGIEEINAGSLDVNTGIDPVTTDSIRVSVPSLNKGRREGKAHMTEEETQASRKTKEQILQEEAGLAKAIKLDALEKALEKEEVAKQVHLDSLIAQRMAEELTEK
ncbi:hypothetical protein Tco_0645036 [Tanacetum coccineum]